MLTHELLKDYLQKSHKIQKGLILFMEKLFKLIKKAEKSKLQAWLLNRVINHTVPFNKPHGFRVIKMTANSMEIFAPYRKKNFNHVRGIHACAIATVGELAAGLLLMSHFSPKEYRIIMSALQIDYHYQAKKDITAMAALSEAEKKNILERLHTEPKTTQTITTEIKDSDNKAIATLHTTWQIKSWKDVQTKVK